MKSDLFQQVRAGTAHDGRNGKGAREDRMHHSAHQPGSRVPADHRRERTAARNLAALGRCGGWFSQGAVPRVVLILVIALVGLGSPAIVAAEDDFELSQRPLTIGGQGVFGNLALVPATTASTINRVANPGPYEPNATYIGYFNSERCYRYNFDGDEESERHFAPHACADDTWDGNFLNWAATQTVDVFRKTMTGGNRVKDEEGVTWLEKAFHTGQTGEEGEELYPDRRVVDDEDVDIANVTPFNNATTLDIRIRGLGNRMRFIVNGDDDNDVIEDLLALALSEEDDDEEDEEESIELLHYDPEEEVEDGQPYDLNVRVSVCESEGSNCVQYGEHWKPEGLIQANAERLRFSAFGYLNDHSGDRDGGVLRARNRWVGPEQFDPESGESSSNDYAEWDPVTGQLIADPHKDDPQHSSEVPANYSGVISFINKFGQLVATDPDHEELYPGHMPFHPVSELYYVALRYFRDLEDISEYSRWDRGNPLSREKRTDLLPVITEWDDPIGAWCEPNAILGFGDTYTDRDTNLVDADTDEVRQFTNKVGELEEIDDIGDNWEGDGIDNSAYIAGLAYQANTTDIRPDLVDGDVTVSTFWIDILRNEEGYIEPPKHNQFYLAAKYGGFTVPSNFNPLLADSLEDPWWHTNDEELETTQGSVKRPDNYYPAGQASDMVGRLENAFDSVVSDLTGSSSAIAANSTRLDTGTLIYQARFNTADWSGQLLAIEVDPDDGSIDTSSPEWDAGVRIEQNWDWHNRRLFSIEPDQRSGIYFDEGTNGVTDEQMDLLGGLEELKYLRGDRSNEIQNGGDFRDRSTLLGDIVNSDPAFVGTQNFGYSVGGSEDSDFEYGEFRRAKHEFDQPMIYVGSNNGMLHGFDAEDGIERFAYVPNAVYENLNELTSPTYSHRYFVDGSPRHGDAYIDRGSGEEWRTYLVGSTGAGGEAVFALDIPDPNNTGFERNDVLWEFTHPELGAAMAQPHIARLNDGGWYVIFGNGYNSASGEAGLFLVPLDDPDNYEFISTGVGGTGEDANGLSHTTPVDNTGDRTTNYIYGGDMQGNVWRFDVNHANNPGNWDAEVMFEASDGTDPQPITAAIEVGPHPSGEGVMTYFGTGQFFEVGDNRVPDDTQTQTFYAVHDTFGGTLDRGDLFRQQIVAFDENFRVVGDEPTPEDKDGWYLDLPINGERVFQRATLRNERIIFVTNIPTEDVCGFGGDSWIMEMNAFLGTGVEEEVFVDADDDFEEGTADGMRFDDMVSRPAIIDTAGDTEFKYLSGSSGDVTQVEESSTTDRLGRRSWREF